MMVGGAVGIGIGSIADTFRQGQSFSSLDLNSYRARQAAIGGGHSHYLKPDYGIAHTGLIMPEIRIVESTENKTTKKMLQNDIDLWLKDVDI